MVNDMVTRSKLVSQLASSIYRRQYKVAHDILVNQLIWAYLAMKNFVKVNHQESDTQGVQQTEQYQ